MKLPLILGISKKKDYILLNPCLIYIGESLCFFFELICKRTSYSNGNEYLENKEKNIKKIRKRDFIYFGIIFLLLLIIDFYKMVYIVVP